MDLATPRTDRLFGRLPKAGIDAHDVADALNSAGIPCYVRCWHLGQTGWFVVHAETYERLNFPVSIDTMPSLSTGNRRLIQQALEQNRDCGCYFCLNIFEADEIRTYSEEGSALCPHCHTDAILVGVQDAQVLAAGLDRWFTGKAIASA